MDDVFVCLGEQRYRVESDWLAAEADLHGLSSVAVLEGGRVAVLFRNAPQVRVFDTDANCVAQWHFPGLVCPHHIVAAPGGGAMITDLDGHCVIGVDADGRQIWTLGRPGSPRWMAPFNHPTDVAMDSEGRLYVTDGYGNFCLHRFDRQRRLIQTHGEPGAGPGQFSTPHAVVVSDDKEVYVADRENSRVQVFDAEGTFLRALTAMYKPMALALTADGSLLVSDQTAALTLFDKAGRVAGRCRVFGVYGHGLAVAPDGAIYISEMLPNRLTRLVREVVS